MSLFVLASGIFGILFTTRLAISVYISLQGVYGVGIPPQACLLYAAISCSCCPIDVGLVFLAFAFNTVDCNGIFGSGFQSSLNDKWSRISETRSQCLAAPSRLTKYHRTMCITTRPPKEVKLPNGKAIPVASRPKTWEFDAPWDFQHRYIIVTA